MNKYRNITTNIIRNTRHITADKQVSIIIVHILKDRQTDSAALVLKHTHTHTHTHTHMSANSMSANCKMFVASCKQLRENLTCPNSGQTGLVLSSTLISAYSANLNRLDLED